MVSREAASKPYCQWRARHDVSFYPGANGHNWMVNEKSEPPERVEVFHHKSNFFRVVHADGCFGGMTPRGGLHMGFYSERSAIPLRTAIPLSEGKPAGPETVLEVRPGLVREIEVDVVMDLSTATSFFTWLRSNLEQMRQAHGVSDEDWQRFLEGNPQ